MTRDRDGSPLEPDDAGRSPAPHSCLNGWTGEDEHGRPVPCLACRPHLARNRRPWLGPITEGNTR